MLITSMQSFHNRYARFQNDPLKTVRGVDYTYSIPYNAKSCLKWLSSKGCNSVKINSSSTKIPHAHLQYVHNRYKRFQKDPLKLREKLITQTLYRKAWRTDRQTDTQTDGQIGANLNAPDYRHGGIIDEYFNDASNEISRLSAHWVQVQRKRFLHVFPVYGHDCHVGNVTWTIWREFCSRAQVPNYHHLFFGTGMMIHPGYDLKLHNLLTCIFIQTINYQYAKPKMLQMKFEPNWASGFNISLKEKVLVDNR